MGLAKFLPAYHTLVHIKLLPIMLSPFLEQVLYLEVLRHFREKVKGFPESFIS